VGPSGVLESRVESMMIWRTKFGGLDLSVDKSVTSVKVNANCIMPPVSSIYPVSISSLLHSVNLILFAYHLITVTTFTLITYHCLYISLQT